MGITSIDDHRKPDGSLDMNSYNKAMIANGEICTECGGYITTFGNGHPGRCRQCKDADSQQELTHDKYIRCPKCGRKWDPYESEQYEILSDGEHSASCVECGHEFQVTTDVSYSFTSPERITPGHDA